MNSYDCALKLKQLEIVKKRISNIDKLAQRRDVIIDDLIFLASKKGSLEPESDDSRYLITFSSRNLSVSANVYKCAFDFFITELQEELELLQIKIVNILDEMEVL